MPVWKKWVKDLLPLLVLLALCVALVGGLFLSIVLAAVVCEFAFFFGKSERGVAWIFTGVDLVLIAVAVCVAHFGFHVI